MSLNNVEKLAKLEKLTSSDKFWVIELTLKREVMPGCAAPG